VSCYLLIEFSSSSLEVRFSFDVIDLTDRENVVEEFCWRLCVGDERLPRSSPGVATQTQLTDHVRRSVVGGPPGRQRITKSQSERHVPRRTSRRKLCNALDQRPARMQRSGLSTYLILSMYIYRPLVMRLVASSVCPSVPPFDGLYDLDFCICMSRDHTARRGLKVKVMYQGQWCQCDLD